MNVLSYTRVEQGVMDDAYWTSFDLSYCFWSSAASSGVDPASVGKKMRAELDLRIVFLWSETDA